MELPKIGETITTERALELCRYFGFETLVKRIVAYPDHYKHWKFDGCSMIPDAFVALLLRVPKLTEICLRHDLKYAYGEPKNDEERLLADYEFGIDLLKDGADANASRTFFHAVQAGGGAFGYSFSWGFAHR